MPSFLRGLFVFTVVVANSFAAKIAVIDSGVDYKHKDLAAKMWTNPNSSTTTAAGTTYQGDTHGWNLAENNADIIDYKYLGTFPNDVYKVYEVQGKILRGTATQADKDWYAQKKADQNFLKELQKFGNFVHGTHVSGISAKDADKAQIIGLKLIPTETPGGEEQMLRDARRAAIAHGRGADNPMAKMLLGMLAQRQAKMLTTAGEYVGAVKADVANGSFGTSVAAVGPVLKGFLKQFLGHEPSDDETRDYSIYFIEQIIQYGKAFVDASPNTLFVFAAGNDGTNNDQLPTSPANIKTDNTIAVAATWDEKQIASFSNYGSANVDVAAPGVVINSTIPGDKYLELSGTSMAAPFVTNVAGMVKDANPSLSPKDIKEVLMKTCDSKSWLSGKVKSGGIVNRDRAVKAAELSVGGNLQAAIAQAKLEVADVVTVSSRARVSDKDLLVLPLPSLF
jgi:subtilisin family serine protease